MTAPTASAAKHCPKYGSPRVHRSHRRSGLEHALGSIGGEIRRCHDCRSRQAWFRSGGISLPAEGATRGRLTKIALFGFTSVACFLLIWWMISHLAELAG